MSPTGSPAAAIGRADLQAIDRYLDEAWRISGSTKSRFAAAALTDAQKEEARQAFIRLKHRSQSEKDAARQRLAELGDGVFPVILERIRDRAHDHGVLGIFVCGI